MSPRISPAVVQLNRLPEFLRSETVGELIAAELDARARQLAPLADPETSQDARALQAQAAIYSLAADQIRKFAVSGGE